MSEKIIKGPKLKLTPPNKTLGELFFDCAEKYKDQICQVDGILDTTETYGSVKLKCTRVALKLQKKGITPSDVIAFCSGNTLDTVIPILATLYIGAKVANLEPTLSTALTQHLISLVRPKIIFVEEKSISLIEDSLKECNLQPEIIIYGQSKKYSTLSELTTPQDVEKDFKPSRLDLDDVALIFFSSGTTGLPKAISHSHRSFTHMGCTLCDYDMGQVSLHFTTFYWITAFLYLIYSHMTGGYRVFFRSLDPEKIFKSIEKYKVENTVLAPFFVDKLELVKNPENYDTSSLRFIFLSGGPATLVQFERLAQLFKQSNIISLYGMTEIGSISAFHPDKDGEFIQTKRNSSGTLFANISLKIVNEDSNEILGPNQKGEIRVKSLSTTKGYYNEDSSEIFDEDGFLKTGDHGYYDEDDCIYFVERIKEMFKYKIWHIVPSFLEAILQQHPAVKEAAVFGVPCGDDGEAPGACIVLKTGTSASKEEIYDFVANKVTDNEKLRGGITFVEKLHKTPTGKLIRKEIRDSVLNS